VSQAALAQYDTVILQPGFIAQSYIKASGTYRATTLTSVPTMIAMILRETAMLEQTDLSAVTTVRMGLARVSQMDAARQAFPRAVITNGYGTSEAADRLHHASRRPADPRSVGRRGTSACRATAGYGDGSAASEGVLPALMSGYHNLPEVTVKALTAAFTSPGMCSAAIATAFITSSVAATTCS
jgi:long-chain acyl-CoA synthetase